MKLHREGFGIIITTLIIVLTLSFLNFWFLYCNEKFIFYILIQLFLLVFLYLIVQFFRIPKRNCEFGEMDIVCPADGKVVVIEETEEAEYFKGEAHSTIHFYVTLKCSRKLFPNQWNYKICEISSGIISCSLASEKQY
mgnify:CR=1 FL=1